MHAMKAYGTFLGERAPITHCEVKWAESQLDLRASPTRNQNHHELNVVWFV
jgi:hypothetical protein